MPMQVVQCIGNSCRTIGHFLGRVITWIREKLGCRISSAVAPLLQSPPDVSQPPADAPRRMDDTRHGLIPMGQQQSIAALRRGDSSLPSPDSSSPLQESNLPRQSITLGQGEYVIYHELENGDVQPISQELFQTLFPVLLAHAPLALVEKGQPVERRDALLNTALKAHDVTLRAVFIPRTLYELIFIRKCIQEDVKAREICIGISYPRDHRLTQERFQEANLYNYKAYVEQRSFADRRLAPKRERCWHVCKFDDVLPQNDLTPGVVEVAYRMNRLITKRLRSFPLKEGLTYQEILQLSEKEIKFLQQHSKNTALADSLKNTLFYETGPSKGPAISFAELDPIGREHMAISTEKEINLINQAIALECSPIAKHHLFLWRGASLERDLPYRVESPQKGHSLSYGTSLFAGCLFDIGATAFYFMRSRRSFAIPVPYGEVEASPFYVPLAHSLTQLYSEGERFHPRTKVWQGCDLETLEGFNGGINRHARHHLASSMSREELVQKFESYKAQAIELNRYKSETVMSH